MNASLVSASTYQLLFEGEDVVASGRHEPWLKRCKGRDCSHCDTNCRLVPENSHFWVIHETGGELGANSSPTVVSHKANKV